VSDETYNNDTAGQRLAGQVRELRVRREHAPVWLPAFEPVRARAAGLPTPETSPHQRIEAPVPPVTDPLPGDAPTWPANQPAVATHSPDPLSPLSGLPADVAQRLRTAVGAEVEHLVVHTDDRADTVAREHRADAVTVGHEIHFRTGRFRPAEPAGFALLAHEAWHATADQRGGTAHRTTHHGAATEERHARAVERQLLSAPAHPAPLAPRAAIPSPATAPPIAPAPATPAARPMAAAEDRDLAASQGEPPPALDLGALREEFLRDVLRQVRTDLERGA
jgi:hypothetical protein